MDHHGPDSIRVYQPGAKRDPDQLSAVARRVTGGDCNSEHERLSRVELQERGIGVTSRYTQDDSRPALRQRRS